MSSQPIGSPCMSLAPPHLCTGCGACAAVCTQGALTMTEDDDGFFVPSIAQRLCVRCGKCVSVCPILNIGKASLNDAAYAAPGIFAAQLKDAHAVSQASSGGAFWALARTMIGKGGVVYGAIMHGVDDVRHVRAETEAEASPMRGSKYIPSRAAEAYRQVRLDLDHGRQVLFSGTPCQVAALNAFLGEKRTGLVTCEVVCHGIPSLKAWRLYVSEKEKLVGKRIARVNFRDKSNGWRRTCYRIQYEDGSDEAITIGNHPFHAAYLKGLMNRQSCRSCRYAAVPRCADISLADFWKYDGAKFREDNIGISLVAVNSSAGRQLLLAAEEFLDLEPSTEEKALASCRHFSRPPLESLSRQGFLHDVDRLGYHGAFAEHVKPRKPSPSFPVKVWRKVKAQIRYRLDREAVKAVDGYFADMGQRAPLWAPPKKVRGTALKMMALRDAFLLLARKGVSVWFVNRVGKMKDPQWRYAPSAKRRMDIGADFPAMLRDPARFEQDLKELFGEKYSLEYVEEIGRIPQIVDICGVKRHEDCFGSLVNVVGGLRVTYAQPEHFNRTVHIYGRCGAFGYAVEDADTMPSRLQVELNDSGHGDVRVINHGLWGGDDNSLDGNFLRDAAGIPSGDVVLFYRKHLDMRLMAGWRKYGVRYLDITARWHEHPEAKWCFYDRPGHMNAAGYRIVAKIIADNLISTGFAPLPVEGRLLADLKMPWLSRRLKAFPRHGIDAEIDSYVTSVRKGLPALGNGDVAGAIVMNCNPFTYGHRRLIETAAKEVDRLYVLVVEEDKSIFPFRVRRKMVEAGTADIANVVVAPSGRFIISSLTFPEYFMKDYVKEKDFDVSADVRTFCEKIAPPLGIKVRFAGTEPFDPVTGAYNRAMAEILPTYGIAFRELPRFALPDGRAISATEVRRLLSSGEWDVLAEYVPETTLEILRENNYAH